MDIIALNNSHQNSAKGYGLSSSTHCEIALSESDRCISCNPKMFKK